MSSGLNDAGLTIQQELKALVIQRVVIQLDGCRNKGVPESLRATVREKCEQEQGQHSPLEALALLSNTSDTQLAD